MAPFAAESQAAVAASPELMERELIKFDALTAALAVGLRRRGADDVTASLAAQAGMTVFRTAYVRWAEADSQGDRAFSPGCAPQSPPEAKTARRCLWA